MSTRSLNYGPTGWAVFAAVVLIIAGAVNFIYGLAAIFRDEVISNVGGQTIVWDLTAWGWIMLLFGVGQVLAGAALAGGQQWGRWTAVVLCGFNAIANVGFITVYPFWTLLIVGLDILVIYQLTARWLPVDPDMAGYDPAVDQGPTSARDQATHYRTGI
jgi:hypothetical protein